VRKCEIGGLYLEEGVRNVFDRSAARTVSMLSCRISCSLDWVVEMILWWAPKWALPPKKKTSARKSSGVALTPRICS
jgi:hypothetical protein